MSKKDAKEEFFRVLRTVYVCRDAVLFSDPEGDLWKRVEAYASAQVATLQAQLADAQKAFTAMESQLNQRAEAAEKEVERLQSLNDSQAESIGGYIKLVQAAKHAGISLSWDGPIAVADNEFQSREQKIREALEAVSSIPVASIINMSPEEKIQLKCDPYGAGIVAYRKSLRDFAEYVFTQISDARTFGVSSCRTCGELLAESSTDSGLPEGCTSEVCSRVGRNWKSEYSKLHDAFIQLNKKYEELKALHTEEPKQ